jgi:hypothetical protein
VQESAEIITIIKLLPKPGKEYQRTHIKNDSAYQNNHGE